MMSALFKSLEPATDACWNDLVHASWQSAACGLLLLAVVALGRRWPAPLRYGLLTVALVKFVLPPFGAASFGGVPFGVFSQLGPTIGASAPATTPADDGMSRAIPIRQSQAGTASSTPSSAELAAPAAVAIFSQRDARPRTNVENSPAFANTMSKIPSVTISQTAEAERPRPVALQWNGRQLALAGWIAGMCLVMAWLCDQGRRLRRVLRGSSPVESAGLNCRMQTLATQVGLRRVPELRQSLAGSVPFSCGLFAPKVVVPAALINELSPEQLDVVLGHELAHHRRGDLWVNALQIVAFVVFWFHPVYWLLNRSMRRVREDCCDDLLLARGLITPEACCETLLAVARGQARSVSLVWSVSMAHPLGRRLTRLMDDSQPRRTRLSRGGWSLVLLVGALFWPGLRYVSAVANDSAPANSVAAPGKETGNAPNAVATPAAGVQDAKGGAKEAVSDDVEYSGQVTDVNGKPLKDAQVYVSYPDGNESKFVPKMKTASDGRFRIRHVLDAAWNYKYPRVVVMASGYGPAFAGPDAFTKSKFRKTTLVLKLPEDDVPIRGQT